jgi:hypothetical protein
MEGLPSIDVSNVLSEEKRQQVIALGRLGWPLRRIQQETGIRRETAGAYLKAAGVAIRAPGGWGRRLPAKPANEVSTDLTVAESGQNRPTVSPDSAPIPLPGRSPRRIGDIRVQPKALFKKTVTAVTSARRTSATLRLATAMLGLGSLHGSVAKTAEWRNPCR